MAEAGVRALSLALGAEARRALDRAAELAVDDRARARLLDQAGRAATMNADYVAARERLQEAVRLFDTTGDRESAARSLAALARMLFQENRLDEALELTRRAVAGLQDGSAEKAAALASLSSNLAFAGELDEGLAAADAALAIGEPLQAWQTVVEAFNTMALIRQKQGRIEEALALRERAVSLAVRNDLTYEALRAYHNLADIPLQLDRFADALAVAERGLELARARGDRHWEDMLTLMANTARFAVGDWHYFEILQGDRLLAMHGLMRLAYVPQKACIEAARGELGSLRETLALATEEVGSTNIEYAAGPVVARAICLRALGRAGEALEVALPIATGGIGVANEDRREAYVEAGLAALELDDEATVEQLIEFVAGLPPALRTPLLRAGAARFAGLLAARRGDNRGAAERLTTAARTLREVDARFHLAQALLERAEIAGDADELQEARTIFSALEATPWLERCEALRAKAPV